MPSGTNCRCQCAAMAKSWQMPLPSTRYTRPHPASILTLDLHELNPDFFIFSFCFCFYCCFCSSGHIVCFRARSFLPLHHTLSIHYFNSNPANDNAEDDAFHSSFLFFRFCVSQAARARSLPIVEKGLKAKYHATLISMRTLLTTMTDAVRDKRKRSQHPV